MSETDAATLSRQLLRRRPTASLATVMDGAPYASLVLVAVDHDATPILLISQLAEHTRNLAADRRVALLFEETEGLEEPLTGPRVTVIGHAEVTTEPRHRERFLARHPGAALYAGFKDFAFYRIAVQRAHLVAGFGRIHWIEGKDLLGRIEPALAAREAGIVEHMNTDHSDAVELYATVLLQQPPGPWRMTGCDPEGADLRCRDRTARLDFAQIVTDADRARAELVRLVRKSREILGERNSAS
jgi:heme iron utilization protein